MSFCGFLNGRRKVKDIQPLQVNLALIFGRDITKTRDNHNNLSPITDVAQVADVLRSNKRYQHHLLKDNDNTLIETT